MYKDGKNHIRPTDILNFYMCETGKKGNQREYQSLKERQNASEIVNTSSERRTDGGEQRGEEVRLGGNENGGKKIQAKLGFNTSYGIENSL